MATKLAEHTLEFLLAFDGRIHRYFGGYWLKFEIRRVAATAGHPHGLRYSFTLHGPDNTRLVGFDNAHAVPATKGRHTKRSSDRSLASHGKRFRQALYVQGRSDID